MSLAGNLPLFRNEKDGGWLTRPNTILVDSEQLESGEAMSDDSRRSPHARSRNSRRNTATASPAATPKPDRRGLAPRGHEHGRQDGQARRTRQVRRQCLDAHRRLGRQHRHPCPRYPRLRHAAPLRAGGGPRPAAHELCRRRRRPVRARNTPKSTACRFRSFPARGSTKEPKPGPLPTRVRALDSRIACEITFPGCSATATTWRPKRSATFTEDSRLSLTTARHPHEDRERPNRRRNQHPHARRSEERRANEVAFLLAKLTLEKYFRDDDGSRQTLAFPAAARHRQALAGRMRHTAKTTRSRNSCF